MSPTGDGYRADADRLASQGGLFEGLAERAAAIHRDLADVLDPLGRCWGTDQVGQSFAAVHSGPADNARGQLSGLSERLDSVGVRFTDTAAAYLDTETSGAERLRSADPADG